MARTKMRVFAYDPQGRPLGNAKALLREIDGSTALSGAFDASVGGSAITEKVSNAQAEIEFYMDEGKRIKVIITDNNNTAYALNTPLSTVSFENIAAEEITVLPPVEDLILSVDHLSDVDNPHVVTKAQIGLGNVENISIVAAVATYIHEQSVPSDTWTINHGQNKYPSVFTVDSGDTVQYGQIQYVDANTVVVAFKFAFGGRAFLN